MAAANRTWGAERIRGELLKLHIQVAKATIQTYLRGAGPPRSSGQSWSTFLHTHAQGIWASDFLPVTDLLFRSIHAFFVMNLASRRIVHVGVTRHPSDAWVTQQLRDATPFGQHPKHMIRDNDSRIGPAFTALAVATGIDEVRTAYRAQWKMRDVSAYLAACADSTSATSRLFSAAWSGVWSRSASPSPSGPRSPRSSPCKHVPTIFTSEPAPQLQGLAAYLSALHVQSHSCDLRMKF
jgi:hypothetical protein